MFKGPISMTGAEASLLAIYPSRKPIRTLTFMGALQGFPQKGMDETEGSVAGEGFLFRQALAMTFNRMARVSSKYVSTLARRCSPSSVTADRDSPGCTMRTSNS